MNQLGAFMEGAEARFISTSEVQSYVILANWLSSS